ncbi:MAG: aminotransferase class V-fold PLP-dependent enzyme, partial [Silvanigrellaceae bacterium]|nr:aminotransferase class V-fold PLP-dependent enzyme [Silvanigrellaceae bacterium]
MKSNKTNFLEHFLLPKEMHCAIHKAKNSLSFGGECLPDSLIYLDFASSTPLDLRVYKKMEPWLLSYFGNPSSFHPMGKMASHALAESRMLIAKVLGVHFEEVIFTASATESNNLVLRGLVENPQRKRKKVVYCATEHSSIANTAKQLSENLGIDSVELPVDEYGQILIAEAKKIIDENTLCVCVMDLNNETGIVQSKLDEVALLAQEAKAHFHIDCVQGFARKKSFHLQQIPFDTCVISDFFKKIPAVIHQLKKRSPG